MKVNRYKRVQRYLSFYRNNFNFHPPYQILIDGTFCQAALKNKVNISEQMPKYLCEQVKLLTTVCVVNETEKLSKSLYGAMLVVKQFAVHRCGHEKNPISASKCLHSLLRKSAQSHYFLATQDSELTELVRQLAYVPLIYLKMNTIVMEKPHNVALDTALKSQEEDLKVAQHQLSTLKTLKKIHCLEEDKTIVKRKRKGPKGPNPLSCKKRKNSPTKTKEQNASSKADNKLSDKKGRKRTKRIPNHIKRMFSKIETQLRSDDGNS